MIPWLAGGPDTRVSAGTVFFFVFIISIIGFFFVMHVNNFKISVIEKW
jgi:hypothetical protein